MTALFEIDPGRGRRGMDLGKQTFRDALEQPSEGEEFARLPALGYGSKPRVHSGDDGRFSIFHAGIIMSRGGTQTVQGVEKLFTSDGQ